MESPSRLGVWSSEPWRLALDNHLGPVIFHFIIDNLSLRAIRPHDIHAKYHCPKDMNTLWTPENLALRAGLSLNSYY